jgi:hypothetical protein
MIAKRGRGAFSPSQIQQQHHHQQRLRCRQNPTSLVFGLRDTIEQTSKRSAPYSSPSSKGPLSVRQLTKSRGLFFSPAINLSTFFLPSKHTDTRQFSSTSSAMTATKIDGTAIAKKIRERIHNEVENTRKSNPRYKPSLKIIQGEKQLFRTRKKC